MTLVEHRAVRMPRLACICAIVAIGLGSQLESSNARAAEAPQPAAQTGVEGSSDSVVAIAGGTKVTEADVYRRDQRAFDKLQAEYETKMQELQHKHEQARYDLLNEKLSTLLDTQALELEAKARHTSTDKVLASLKVAAVTDKEARDYYEANKARTNQSFDQLKGQITGYLANDHNTRATRSFYENLRAKHGVESLLEPYRVAVVAVGPQRSRRRPESVRTARACSGRCTTRCIRIRPP